MNDYYVYQLVRPWNNVPCYVGKGRGKRAWTHARLGVRHYNSHLARIFAKADKQEVPVVMLATGLTEGEAFALETRLIKEIGRANRGKGPLCNWTDGGDGVAGRSRISRERARQTHAAIWTPAKREEHKAIMRASNTAETRARKSEGMKASWARRKAEKEADREAV